MLVSSASRETRSAYFTEACSLTDTVLVVPVVDVAALAVVLVVAGELHAASRLVIMAMDQSLLPVIMFFFI
ncbi:hypothetical protein D3C74_496960 [compost metagenome]